MQLSEYLEDLDPQLAADLERAIDAVRREFDERLNATVEETVRSALEQAAPAPAAPESRETPAVSATLSLDAADELRLAAMEIDVATSQSEVLEALSRGVRRFASRVAIFVNRGDQVNGWSSLGFGDADGRIREVAFGGDVPLPMADYLGEGSVALGAQECSAICDTLGVEHSSMGLLLPFVLGSQVVGTVYCDRLGTEAFSVSALQLLTYVAGQTLETLPVRKRESTATLSLASAGAVDTMPTVPAAIETPAPAVPVPEPEPEPEPEPAEPEPATEPEIESIAATPEVTLDGPVEEAVESTASSPAEPAVEAAVSPDLEPPAEALPGIGLADPSPSALEPEPAMARTPVEDTAPAGELRPEPAAVSAAAGESTQIPPEPVIGLSSTQVVPPNDLQGPGWAFTSADEPSAANSESEHEEAQRLARLLITEIKLYNEDAVEQGRRDANVYSRLREDIDRSRQIFEDRIDPSVREGTDYFKQALVRILAGGDPALLGI